MFQAKTIVVAVDLGENAQEVVSEAFEFAKCLDAKVHLVHVYKLEGVQNEAAVLPSVVDEARARAVRQLDSLADRFRATGRLGRAVVYHGPIVATLVAAAKELEADLIVVASHGRRGLGRLVLGSVAEGVLRNATCPVLMVRRLEHPR